MLIFRTRFDFDQVASGPDFAKAVQPSPGPVAANAAQGRLGSHFGSVCLRFPNDFVCQNSVPRARGISQYATA